MDCFDLLAVQGSLKSLLQHRSLKASILQHSALFTVQLSHPYMTTGKTIALTRWTFVDKVMSVLSNMLSTLVIAFLPRSKHLLISCLQSLSAMILEPPKIKSLTVSTVSPSICHEVMEITSWSERNQSWMFIGRTDAEVETPILWPPDVKSWLIWKDPVSGKDWGWEEKGTTEDEMVGWHHWLNGHRFGWTLGVGDGQGGLVCCGSWSCKESPMSEQLNWWDWMPWSSFFECWVLNQLFIFFHFHQEAL